MIDILTSIMQFFTGLSRSIIDAIRVIWKNTIGKLIVTLFAYFTTIFTVFQLIYERIETGIASLDMWIQQAIGAVPSDQLGSTASNAAAAVAAHPLGAYMLGCMSFEILAGLMLVISPFLVACIGIKLVTKAIQVITEILPGF